MRPAGNGLALRHLEPRREQPRSVGTFLWTALAKGEVAQFSQLALIGLPIGFVAGLLFM
ncbi:hypothetical protein [Streptomyces europaeiscabiei]|uniref:hypothetical protein n=1 Tax=Streptomyces europaeiscabiei TaxID=146819 RepID=UPI002E18731B